VDRQPNLIERLAGAGRVLFGKAPETMPTEGLGLPVEAYFPFKSTWEDAAAFSVDTLVAERGPGIYRTMFDRDDQIASCLNLMICARLSSGHTIIPASDDEKDKEISRFIDDDLTYLKEGSLNRTLIDAMEATYMSHCCIEKRYRDPYPTGEWAGKIGFRCFSPMPQESIEVKRDEHGDIEPDGIWQSIPPYMPGPSLEASSFRKMPRDRFALWTWFGKYGTPKGQSMLRPAYRWYFAKDQALLWWGRWLEYHGQPFFIATVDKNMPPKERNALLDKMRKWQSQQRGIKDAGTTLDIIDPSTSPGANFEQFMNICNRAIGRILLTPELVMGTSGVGSYALGAAQKTNYEWVLDVLGRLLEQEFMHQQVIAPHVALNYGEDFDAPTFQFKPFSQPDLTAISTMVKTLKDAGLPIATSYVYKAVGMDPPDEDEDTLGATENPDELPVNPFEPKLIGGKGNLGPGNSFEPGNPKNPLKGLPKEVIEEDKQMMALLAAIQRRSADPSGDDLVQVLRGEDKAIRDYARNGWEK
jgi:hypothetical protein